MNLTVKTGLETLLRKYMEHVYLEEGTTFAHLPQFKPRDFTDDEWNYLMAMSKEVVNAKP